MSVLLIAEHNNSEVKPFTFNAISAATQINEDVHVLVLGFNSDDVAKSISEVPNVKKGIHINNSLYENYLVLYIFPRAREYKIDWKIYWFNLIVRILINRLIPMDLLSYLIIPPPQNFNRQII